MTQQSIYIVYHESQNYIVTAFRYRDDAEIFIKFLLEPGDYVIREIELR